MASPGTATAVRSKVVATTSSIDEAVLALLQIAQQAARESKSELEAQIKALNEQIKRLGAQADKLKKLADKMEKLLPEVTAAVATDNNCKASSVIVAARTGKLLQFLTEIEAAMAQAGGQTPPSIRVWATKFRTLVGQMPTMFDVPRLAGR